MVSDEQLLLRHHLGLFPGLGELPENLRQNAIAAHIICVDHGIRELAHDLHNVARSVRSEDALEFAYFGVMNRLMALSSSFRALMAATNGPHDRAKSQDDLNVINRDLNAIYINILGIFDNYAWLIVYEFGQGRVDLDRKAAIGLFRYGLWNNLDFTVLSGALRLHDDWFRLLKERRDPAAHRIPLSVPPALMDDPAALRYQQLEADYWRHMAGHDPEMADVVREEQARLGVFEPIFKHHSREPVTPIFPTVQEDCATLVAIGRTVHAFIRQLCENARQAGA